MTAAAAPLVVEPASRSAGKLNPEAEFVSAWNSHGHRPRVKQFPNDGEMMVVGAPHQGQMIDESGLLA